MSARTYANDRQPDRIAADGSQHCIYLKKVFFCLNCNLLLHSLQMNRDAPIVRVSRFFIVRISRSTVERLERMRYLGECCSMLISLGLCLPALRVRLSIS